MQLNQGLESADGGSGGVGVDQPSDEQKMNMISRDFFVIFCFFWVLVVKGGCTVLHINISSLIEKKSFKRTISLLYYTSITQVRNKSFLTLAYNSAGDPS